MESVKSRLFQVLQRHSGEPFIWVTAAAAGFWLWERYAAYLAQQAGGIGPLL